MQELACMSAWPLLLSFPSHPLLPGWKPWWHLPPSSVPHASPCAIPPDLLLHPLPCHLFLCPHPIRNSPRVTKSLPPFRCILGDTFFRKASWPDGLMASPHFRGPEPRTSELAHSSSNASSLKSACGRDCELFKCRRRASSLRDPSSNVFAL